MYGVDRVDSKNKNVRTRQEDTRRLGTELRPALLRVQTEERKAEVTALCGENGWSCSVEVDADQPEDVADLDVLQNPVTTARVEAEPKRNDPCPCGSGKKYKHCHARK